MSSLDQLLDDLNPEQHIAVTHGNGPLLIVAGAGTGKTSVITRRIAWLIRENLATPEEILALTFTEKAAAEMEERVLKLLPYGYTDLWISTFHAFAEKLIKAHALEIGLPDKLQLLDTTSQWMLLKENLDKLELNYWRPLGNPTKFIHALLRHFSRAKDELVTPSDYLQFAEALKLSGDNTEILSHETQKVQEIANAYQVYENLLLEGGATDFGGLINWALVMLKKRPAILKKYQKQFKYILVDEFQDTNFSQFELVKLIAGTDRNLTVVGDDDQSIYKFRGASISNILEFKRDFSDSKEVYLTKNYRTKQNILDLSYKFIQQNNPYRLEVKLGGEGSLSKKLIASNGGEGIIEHIKAQTQFDEAQEVINKIIELKNNDPTRSWNDFAILVRANDHAGTFIRALSDSGIPYDFVASKGLYVKPIIVDLISYLRLLCDSFDSVAAYRILNFPCWRLNAPEISKLLYWANRKGLPLFAALKGARIFNEFDLPTLEKLKKIEICVEKHSELARRVGVDKVILQFLQESEYLKTLMDSPDGGSAEIGNLNQFWKLVQDFTTAEKEAGVKKFLDRINLEIEAGEEGALEFDPDSGPESVKILTVHSSKGLEFAFVFLVNLVDRRFPTTERSEVIEFPEKLIKEVLPEGNMHLQEERRLFYVGCTRAKEGLFFTSAEDYGGARAKKPSQFLEEIGIVAPKKELVKSRSFVYREVSQNQNDVSKQPVYIPSKFSFTQMKAFLNCPLQYKFSHILKIPVRGRATFSFGQSIHLALQKFLEVFLERKNWNQQTLFASPEVKPGQIPDFEELLKLYEISWQDDWYASPEAKKQYFEKGKKLLRDFYDDIKNNPPRVIALELPFTLKIGEVIFRGKIDRIDLNSDGSVNIIDYKTGAPKDLSSVEKDQLYIYQIAANEVLFPQRIIPGAASSLTFYYLEDGSKVSFLGSDEELDKFKKKVEKCVGEIKQSTFPATPSAQKCRFCDFKDICEFRQI